MSDVAIRRVAATPDAGHGSILPSERGITARLLLALSLTLGACAVANTPQQNLAYERWAKCNTAYADLQYVDLDGQMTVRISNTSTAQDVIQCLAEAGRGGRPLPAPVFVRPPGGP